MKKSDFKYHLGSVLVPRVNFTTISLPKKVQLFGADTNKLDTLQWWVKLRGHDSKGKNT